jgi:prepilin peptidase CpaA
LIAIVFRLVIISILLLLALVSDFKTYRIKNSITYGFMLVGIIANTAMEGFRGIMLSFQGIMLPAICLLILYMMKIIGAGDIKLLSAIGAVMGAGFALYASALAFICGGVIASAVLLRRHNGAERFKYLILYLKSCFLSGLLLPYADFADKHNEGRFHFSIAVASGTAVAVIIRGIGFSIL